MSYLRAARADTYDIVTSAGDVITNVSFEAAWHIVQTLGPLNGSVRATQRGFHLVEGQPRRMVIAYQVEAGFSEKAEPTAPVKN